jgi:hypothetical protein
VYGVSIAPPLAAQWRQEYGFFDQSSSPSKVSIFNMSSGIELLKYFLLPFGLTCEIVTAGLGDDPYLDVHEFTDAATTEDIHTKVLAGLQLSPGERAAFGLTVAVHNDRQQYLGRSDDQSIDIPFMGFNRIVAKDAPFRNNSFQGWVSDAECLMQGLYVENPGIANRYHAVYKVKVANSGTPVKTIHGAFPSGNYDTYGFGGLFGWAAVYYYFSTLIQGSGVNALGISRRIQNSLTMNLAEVNFGRKPGQIVNGLPGLTGDWTVREAVCKPFEFEGEITADRGDFA